MSVQTTADAASESAKRIDFSVMLEKLKYMAVELASTPVDAKREQAATSLVFLTGYVCGRLKDQTYEGLLVELIREIEEKIGRSEKK